MGKKSLQKGQFSLAYTYQIGMLHIGQDSGGLPHIKAQIISLLAVSLVWESNHVHVASI